MHIVSFETAKALKGAGFPQPEPVFGQAYYMPYLRKDEGDGFVSDADICVVSVQNKVEYLDDLKAGVYAPTATDILPELPEGYVIYKDHSSCGGFICYHYSKSPIGRQCYKNPAEAVAAKWLELNNRQPA